MSEILSKKKRVARIRKNTVEESSENDVVSDIIKSMDSNYSTELFLPLKKLEENKNKVASSSLLSKPLRYQQKKARKNLPEKTHPLMQKTQRSLQYLKHNHRIPKQRAHVSNQETTKEPEAKNKNIDNARTRMGNKRLILNSNNTVLKRQVSDVLDIPNKPKKCKLSKINDVQLQPSVFDKTKCKSDEEASETEFEKFILSQKNLNLDKGNSDSDSVSNFRKKKKKSKSCNSKISFTTVQRKAVSTFIKSVDLIEVKPCSSHKSGRKSLKETDTNKNDDGNDNCYNDSLKNNENLSKTFHFKPLSRASVFEKSNHHDCDNESISSDKCSFKRNVLQQSESNNNKVDYVCDTDLLDSEWADLPVEITSEKSNEIEPVTFDLTKPDIKRYINNNFSCCFVAIERLVYIDKKVPNLIDNSAKYQESEKDVSLLSDDDVSLVWENDVSIVSDDEVSLVCENASLDSDKNIVVDENEKAIFNNDIDHNLTKDIAIKEKNQNLTCLDEDSDDCEFLCVVSKFENLPSFENEEFYEIPSKVMFNSSTTEVPQITQPQTVTTNLNSVVDKQLVDSKKSVISIDSDVLFDKCSISSNSNRKLQKSDIVLPDHFSCLQNLALNEGSNSEINNEYNIKIISVKSLGESTDSSHSKNNVCDKKPLKNLEHSDLREIGVKSLTELNFKTSNNNLALEKLSGNIRTDHSNSVKSLKKDYFKLATNYCTILNAKFQNVSTADKVDVSCGSIKDIDIISNQLTAESNKHISDNVKIYSSNDTILPAENSINVCNSDKFPQNGNQNKDLISSDIFETISKIDFKKLLQVTQSEISDLNENKINCALSTSPENPIYRETCISLDDDKIPDMQSCSKVLNDQCKNQINKNASKLNSVNFLPNKQLFCTETVKLKEKLTKVNSPELKKETESLSDELDIVACTNIHDICKDKEENILPLLNLYLKECQRYQQIISTEINVSAGLKMLEDAQREKVKNLQVTINHCLKYDPCFQEISKKNISENEFMKKENLEESVTTKLKKSCFSSNQKVLKCDNCLEIAVNHYRKKEKNFCSKSCAEVYWSGGQLLAID